MADGIEPTEQEIKIAREGLQIQFTAHCPEYKPVMESHFGEFLDHQAKVIASERARCRELERILHKDMGLV